MAYKLSNQKKIQPVDTPCKKAIYDSREAAEDMIRFVKETRSARDLFTYKCTVCGFWHLTSKSK